MAFARTKHNQIEDSTLEKLSQMLYSKHRPIFVEEGNTHNKTEFGKKKHLVISPLYLISRKIFSDFNYHPSQV